MMAGAFYQYGFRLGALVAQRAKKSLRLVVMNESVLVAVNDKIFRPRLAGQPLQPMQRREALVIFFRFWVRPAHQSAGGIVGAFRRLRRASPIGQIVNAVDSNHGANALP